MALFTLTAHNSQVRETSMSILSLLEMEIHRTAADTHRIHFETDLT